MSTINVGPRPHQRPPARRRGPAGQAGLSQITAAGHAPTAALSTMLAAGTTPHSPVASILKPSISINSTGMRRKRHGRDSQDEGPLNKSKKLDVFILMRQKHAYLGLHS